jgi:hypothetical protein
LDAAIIDRHKTLLEKGAVEVTHLIHIFHPTTPDSDDMADIGGFRERLHALLSAAAQAQQNLTLTCKGGAVALKVPSEAHPHSSGLQVIECVEDFLKECRKYLDEENARPTLRPGAKITHIISTYESLCRNLYEVLCPKNHVASGLMNWRLQLLETEDVYFMSPHFYTTLCGDGKELYFGLARQWTENVDYGSILIGIPVLE